MSLICLSNKFTVIYVACKFYIALSSYQEGNPSTSSPLASYPAFPLAVYAAQQSVCCVTSNKQKSSVWAELAVWCLCYAFPFPGSGRDPHDSHLYLHPPFAATIAHVVTLD